MNKKELTIVVALILLMFVWMIVDSTFIKPFFPDPPEPEPTPEAVQQLPNGTPEAAATAVPGTGENPAQVAITDPGQESEPPVQVPEVEEKTYEFSMEAGENSTVNLTFSNRGAALRQAVLLGYPETIEAKEDPSSDPVILDFSSAPALVYARGWLTEGTPFTVTELAEGGLQFTATLPNEILMERTVTHRGGYELEITDRLFNNGDASVAVPGMDLLLGKMLPRENISQRFGPYVGVDAQHTGGVGIKHYVKEIRKGLKNNATFTQVVPQGMDWFGVKNKFFTQVMTLESSDWPEPDALWMEATESEGPAMVGSAQAAVRMNGAQLNPGQALSRTYGYYVGPISMGNLGALGEGQQDVIDYRLWRIFLPITAVMMQGLNGLYGVVGNWGLAIIFLTLVVRMLIWPLSLKGTENMKKMSELSPQIKEMREKYKNNPQKLNTEMSKLYKENKVNPMAGCLPMFIQMPIFISLYGVLRVHVGLRFEDFLWIRDLSEQEAILTIAGVTLNILPLTMTASMIYLQRMTPSNMDPQQQKIMMFMPIMFLFICYNMPAGLLLYMNTSNLVSISQTFYTKRRDEKRKAAQGGASTASPASKAKKNAKK